MSIAALDAAEQALRVAWGYRSVYRTPSAAARVRAAIVAVRAHRKELGL